MNFESCLKILNEKGYKIEKDEIWDGYYIHDENNENVDYGANVMSEEEVIDYVKNYIL